MIADHQGSDPKNVVRAAKEAKRARDIEAEQDDEDPFDEVWVVFDTEGPQNLQRQTAARNAVEDARQLGFLTAVSNPCFEFWILLHFEWCVQAFPDGNAVCHRLKKHIQNYQKNTDSYHLTRLKTGDAIVHAKRVFQERHTGKSHHPCDCHPCTEVYRLVESLLSNR